jgi:hypothetical protein
MKTFLQNSLFFVLILFCTQIVKSQTIVKVKPGFATLNNAIATEADKGNEVVSNTIFELQRGGEYLLNGSVQNDGFTLNIRAEDGEGERPKLIPAVASGGESERAFRPRGDLNIKGLFVTNRDELGGMNLRIIRCSADDITIRIDDCILDSDNQSAVRLDNDGISVFITNSTISNIGLPSDANNGRGVDDRGNDIDSLVIENSTFYNITSRILRDGGGIINYCKVNHNHFVNIGQRLLSLGEVIEVEFTNNLVYNAGFVGDAPNTNYELLEIDTLKKDLTDQGFVQTVKINNNNFFLSSEISDVYPDSVSITPVYDSIAQIYADAQGSEDTQLNEGVTFLNGAVVPTYIVAKYWSDRANTPLWDNTGAPYDFEYENTSQSYSYSSAQQPLGALTWFDMDIISGAEIVLNESDNNLDFQTYPNPASGTINFSFKLKDGDDVEIEFYDMLGQKVNTVTKNYFNTGSHTVHYNLKNMIPGVYISKIKTNNSTYSKTIIVK